jgi:hypothetical protein
VTTLCVRGARHGGDPADVGTWHDDWPAWGALCRDAHERALLVRIRTVAETGEHEELYLHMLDLQS